MCLLLLGRAGPVMGPCWARAGPVLGHAGGGRREAHRAASVWVPPYLSLMLGKTPGQGGGLLSPRCARHRAQSPTHGAYIYPWPALRKLSRAPASDEASCLFSPAPVPAPHLVSGQEAVLLGQRQILQLHVRLLLRTRTRTRTYTVQSIAFVYCL